ncbi:VRR-NUC domain-containing protein [Vibrio gazogenes]|uniref:VRR-NUC domain-containing protein n=1 Tax=Vibrio gazogenes DSM 21264 = NBRC 103151 TaxID=1123492 RepID=A0A1M5A3Z6_VIBGA|nr:VRR-NUC domain-containing protein [Vibrio gazogenes]USP13361.1 VRR-NUC domain-containing protein [Vibrio gazogenes]SHF25023.1 VRR-NUC domain-containing protein [Vibrio gazogenes DSM 21264] [Vibrio gazogenes DSM 21264 = NBRC 103151]SJN57017.1 hypothetical protein BQ6471_02335 [Vibrio gazogenes]
MSNPSCSSCPPFDPEGMSELAVICSLICVCNKKPLKSTGGDRNLKQQCVNEGIRWMHRGQQGKNILPEVGYNMYKSPPEPLMMSDDPTQPIRSWQHRYNRTLKSLPEGQSYESGGIRIPDIVITEDLTKAPTQDNIRQIVEIKFPGDKWGIGQKKAYEKIAGKSRKVKELSPNRCGCGDETDQKEPVAVPHQVLQDAWDKERDRQQQLQQQTPWRDVGIAVVAGLAVVALVLDDLLPTGATQADDALIPVAGSSASVAASRAIAGFARAFSVPVAVPVLAP